MWGRYAGGVGVCSICAGKASAGKASATRGTLTLQQIVKACMQQRDTYNSTPILGNTCSILLLLGPCTQVDLGYLRSYESMGMAVAKCTSGVCVFTKWKSR